MYGLPETTDLSFFQGESLIQVCVGQNEVILQLSGHISVMLASLIRLKSPTGEERLIEDARQSGAALLPLIGSSVSAVHAVSPGTLRLAWISGEVLQILDS
jgi:Family of unknown function (DUF6188)